MTTDNSANTDSISWTEQARVARLIGWVASAIATLVTVAAPVLFFGLSYSAEQREALMDARLHAAIVTQVITQRPNDWRSHVSGLIEADLAPVKLPEQRTLSDMRGQLISRSGPAVAAPTMTTTAVLTGLTAPVGQVTIHRSLQPLLWRTGGVALLGLLLGAVIYGSLRTLPMRALRDALLALRRAESSAREQAEQRLDTIFRSAIDGIVTVTPQNQILSVNPAAQRMFGRSQEDLCGQLLNSLIEHGPARPDGETLIPGGQYESAIVLADGLRLPVEITVNDAPLGDQAQSIVVFRDMTERKMNETRLEQLAHYDSLTGLPNRGLFRDRLEQAIARTHRNGKQLALMLLDLDNFKAINDNLGHDHGDLLLQQVSKALAECLRETDTVTVLSVNSDVYRLGGDEFVVLLEDLVDPDDAAMLAQRIIDRLAQPIMIRGQGAYIGASVGITLCPADGRDLDSLIKQADMAMYRAKAQGRGIFQFFSYEIAAEALVRRTLEQQLRTALTGGEFHLHYQPKANFADGRITGVEALLRWNRPQGTPVGPDRFVPILEETGLIVAVGQWVLQEACAQMMRWEQEGITDLKLAVNLSARQFRQVDLIESILKTLATTGFDPHRLEIELTESMLIQDSERAVQVMLELGKHGIRTAIDDFGTGHSSLSYLHRFKINTLKIDRSFVQDFSAHPDHASIATAVIALGHGLGHRVIAEGVETLEQAEFLRRHGCDEMQGYLLARPLPAVEFGAWLAAYRHAPGLTQAAEECLVE